VERLCDRSSYERGKIEADDSPDQIMARYNRATLEEVVSGRRARRARQRRRDEIASIADFAASHPCDGAALLVFADVVVPRLLELVYWPALQMITWGFLHYSRRTSGFARAGGTLTRRDPVGILFRGHSAFRSRFSRKWPRNLGNLMMSPLKPIEFLIS